MRYHFIIIFLLSVKCALGQGIIYEWTDEYRNHITFPEVISILHNADQIDQTQKDKNQITFLQESLSDDGHINLFRSYVAGDSIGLATISVEYFPTNQSIILHNTKVVNINFATTNPQPSIVENHYLITLKFDKVEFVVINDNQPSILKRFGWDFVNQQEFGENSKVENYGVHDTNNNGK